ncbi:MAG: AAA family ATPase, partial [Pseudomonadota bacterium]
MARPGTTYVCRSCGAVHRKWAGQCGDCGAWNSIEEDAGLAAAGPAKKTLGSAKGRSMSLVALSGDEAPPPRATSGMAELDRVLGGGLVPGSAVLVGGDPGIGKSTLLLQAAAAFGARGLKVIYVSGEEASAQIRMRAQRLGLAEAPVMLAAETNLRDILTTLEAEKPDLVVIDSIQTMWADHVESAPGAVSQVRATAHELTAHAKRRGPAMMKSARGAADFALTRNGTTPALKAAPPTVISDP